MNQKYSDQSANKVKKKPSNKNITATIVRIDDSLELYRSKNPPITVILMPNMLVIIGFLFFMKFSNTKSNSRPISKPARSVKKKENNN